MKTKKNLEKNNKYQKGYRTFDIIKQSVSLPLWKLTRRAYKDEQWGGRKSSKKKEKKR